MPVLKDPGWTPAPAEPGDRRSRLTWYADVARWAPSKHNAQPWRFVVRDDRLEVWADPGRTLPDTDPERRELVLSLGAAVHLACVAARAAGALPRVSVQPEGPGGPLAVLDEAGSWTTTELDRALLAAVPVRRTDRGPLDGEALPSDLPFALQDAADAEGATLRLVTSLGDRSTLAELVERADRLLLRSGAVDRELADWKRERGDPRRDGVPTDHTRGAAASYRAELVQRDFGSEGTRPAQDRPGPDRPLVAVLCTCGDGTGDRLAAGRALAAVLLRATLAGASASYVNQPVEHASMRSRLRDDLSLPGHPQLVLRLGVGGEVAPTPRRNPDEVTFQA